MPGVVWPFGMGPALVLIALACAVLSGCPAPTPKPDPAPVGQPADDGCSDLDLPAGAVCPPPRDGGPDAPVAVPPRAEKWARR